MVVVQGYLEKKNSCGTRLVGKNGCDTGQIRRKWLWYRINWEKIVGGVELMRKNGCGRGLNGEK